MFNTEWNHYLQQFDAPFIISLMKSVSFLGTTSILTLMIYLLIGGIDFRKGFGVANIFLYVLLVTILLKDTIDFPRPLAVDASLVNFGSEVGPNLADLQPRKFWEVFSDELLTEIRKGDIGRYGWPSGHVSLIISIFLGSALIFKRKALWYLAFTLIILTMISRLYLAKHYLGDVIGGLLVGVVISSLIHMIWRVLHMSTLHKISKYQLYFLLSPLIFLIIPMYLPSFQLGTLVGFNLSFIIVISHWGVPVFTNNLLKRIGAVAIFFISGYLILTLTRRTDLPNYTFPAVLSFIFSSMIAFLLAAWICFKSGLWSLAEYEADRDSLIEEEDNGA